MKKFVYAASAFAGLNAKKLMKKKIRLEHLMHLVNI